MLSWELSGTSSSSIPSSNAILRLTKNWSEKCSRNSSKEFTAQEIPSIESRVMSSKTPLQCNNKHLQSFLRKKSLCFRINWTRSKNTRRKKNLKLKSLHHQPLSLAIRMWQTMSLSPRKTWKNHFQRSMQLSIKLFRRQTKHSKLLKLKAEIGHPSSFIQTKPS